MSAVFLLLIKKIFTLCCFVSVCVCVYVTCVSLRQRLVIKAGWLASEVNPYYVIALAVCQARQSLHGAWLKFIQKHNDH